MKNILVINGHPDNKSYNHALAAAYTQGAKSTQANIQQIEISALSFNPNLSGGYRRRTDLEPDLQTAIQKIEKADHIVWVFPMWWQGTPAILKGFIDRTFLPGITYLPIEGKPFPKKLLKGKSSRIIVTSDTPRWYDTLVMKSPTINHFKKGILQFCGVGPIKVTYISPIKNSNKNAREQWLVKVKKLGAKMS